MAIHEKPTPKSQQQQQLQPQSQSQSQEERLRNLKFRNCQRKSNRSSNRCNYNRNFFDLQSQTPSKQMALIRSRYSHSHSQLSRWPRRLAGCHSEQPFRVPTYFSLIFCILFVISTKPSLCDDPSSTSRIDNLQTSQASEANWGQNLHNAVDASNGIIDSNSNSNSNGNRLRNPNPHETQTASFTPTTQQPQAPPPATTISPAITTTTTATPSYRYSDIDNNNNNYNHNHNKYKQVEQQDTDLLAPNWRQLEHRLDRLEFEVRVSSHTLRKLALPVGAQKAGAKQASTSTNLIGHGADDESTHDANHESVGRKQFDELAFEQSRLGAKLGNLAGRMDLVERFVAQSIGRLYDLELKVKQLAKCDCKMSCKFALQQATLHSHSHDNHHRHYGHHNHHQAHHVRHGGSHPSNHSTSEFSTITTTRMDGESWHHKCDLCSCQRGQVRCKRQACPRPKCEWPVHVEGHCCPLCFQSCKFGASTLRHGENLIISGQSHKICKRCTCNDGKLDCKRIRVDTSTNSSHLEPPKEPASKLEPPEAVEAPAGGALREPKENLDDAHYEGCPSLAPHCPEHMQIELDSDCCPRCLSDDFCAIVNQSHGHSNSLRKSKSHSQAKASWCHPEAECVRILSSSASSSRSWNFTRNSNSKLAIDDLIGCRCRQGFEGDGRLECRDIDECRDGNRCNSTTSLCVNLHGSFACKCRRGYELASGTGNNPPSQSESPDCVDIDECSRFTSKCHPKASCINTQGSYKCKCRRGYLGNGFECTRWQPLGARARPHLSSMAATSTSGQAAAYFVNGNLSSHKTGQPRTPLNVDTTDYNEHDDDSNDEDDDAIEHQDDDADGPNELVDNEAPELSRLWPPEVDVQNGHDGFQFAGDHYASDQPRASALHASQQSDEHEADQEAADDGRPIYHNTRTMFFQPRPKLGPSKPPKPTPNPNGPAEDMKKDVTTPPTSTTEAVKLAADRVSSGTATPKATTTEPPADTSVDGAHHRGPKFTRGNTNTSPSSEKPPKSGTIIASATSLPTRGYLSRSAAQTNLNNQDRRATQATQGSSAEQSSSSSSSSAANWGHRRWLTTILMPLAASWAILRLPVLGSGRGSSCLAPLQAQSKL